MLKVGDHVYINGTDDEGTVKAVHPHEVTVSVSVSGANGREDRKYAYESVRLDPTMSETSEYRDH
jgi:hypothetical protein